MAAEVNAAASLIIEWYRGAGSVKSIKRGLDERSFIIELSGRKEIKVLAVIYDPSTDEDIQEFVDSLVDSYRRARIGFDRLDLWIPSPFYSGAQALLEEAERRSGWEPKVILRPLEGPADIWSGRTDETKRASIRPADTPAVRVSEPSREPRESKEMSLLIREVGREIGEGIAKSLQDSLKNILSSIDIRKSDPELMAKIYELEKRVELLESFIRILGSYGVTSVPQIHREPLPAQERPRSPRVEAPRVEEVVRGAEEVIRREEVIEPTPSTDDVLAEILNNPWVSILRRKGDEVGSEGS